MAYQFIIVGYCKLTLSADGSTLIHGEPTVGGEFALDLSRFKGLKVIGEQAFAGCKTLIKLVLPQGLEEIGVSAFFHCKALASINLPESLKHIRNNAYMRCAFESITLPVNLLTIGMRAFAGCSRLKTVTFSCVALEQAHPGAFVDSFPRFILPNLDPRVLKSLLRTNFHKRFNLIENVYAGARFFPSFSCMFNVGEISETHERLANRGLIFCVLLCAYRIDKLSGRPAGQQATQRLPRLPLEMWCEVLKHVRCRLPEQELWGAPEQVIVRPDPSQEQLWCSRLLSGEISFYSPLMNECESFFEKAIAVAFAGEASEPALASANNA